MKQTPATLRLKHLGIDTYQEAVIYMRQDCPVCRSEGFEAHARIEVALGDKKILATLHTVESELLQQDEVGLSNYAWRLLGAESGQQVTLSHPQPLPSLRNVRAKIFGERLLEEQIYAILQDVAQGFYSDIHISAFLTACAGGRINLAEIIALTKAMIDIGDRLQWTAEQVVDKHCVGGLPGNRTSLIVVPIVAAFGLTMPKTSSRAITSPAGTADTMEVLAPVELTLQQMRQVVEQEGGCIVWGGAVELSPADDILIRVERALELDSEGQLVASVLSKKVSAGSTHMVIDIPVGPTAKVRSQAQAETLRAYFTAVGRALGVQVKPLITDGSQPVGVGIGPVLEARDVLAVLQNQAQAPGDLRERALTLAGYVLEFSGKVAEGKGKLVAEKILQSGQAWQKFQAICDAQGGLREPKLVAITQPVLAEQAGVVQAIDNRQLAHLAKLAGAPRAKAAGVEVHCKVGDTVQSGQALLTLHAETKTELSYAMSLFKQQNIIQLTLK
jgi:thymidine phosphorylase